MITPPIARSSSLPPAPPYDASIRGSDREHTHIMSSRTFTIALVACLCVAGESVLLRSDFSVTHVARVPVTDADDDC